MLQFIRSMQWYSAVVKILVLYYSMLQIWDGIIDSSTVLYFATIHKAVLQQA